MAKQITLERKMNFLKHVKGNKEILFGAFSERLKKTDKVEKWKELANLAKSLCLIPAEKDWTYARDTLWQNLKKITMNKLDNARKTGTGGVGKMTDLDNIVMDILGKDYPVGLGVSESIKVENPLPQHSASTEQPVTQDQGMPSTRGTGQRKRSMRCRAAEISDDQKREKLDLEIEYLRLQNYKTKLEILQLEATLRLPRSEFTQCFDINL